MDGFVLQYKNCIVTRAAGYCIVLQYMEIKKKLYCNREENCIASEKLEWLVSVLQYTIVL